MSNFLFKNKRGFSGITHCLIALVIFELIWLLPFFNILTQGVKDSSTIFIIIYWGCLIGAALLPDLDGNVSSAGYALGLLGGIMHIFLVSTSSLVYNLIRTGKDKTNSQHRMFWHAPISSVILFAYGFFCYNSIKDHGTIVEVLKQGFSSEIFNYIFLEILIISSFYLMLTKLYYNIGKIRPLKKLTRFLQPLTIFIFAAYVIFKGTPLFILKVFSAVCLGWLFHIIGDLFSLGSVPLFFPIKVKGVFWYKPWFPFQIETNGTLNKILDIILTIVSVVLMLIIWKGKDFIISLVI